jgi:flagellar secretion chaperone FliS
MTPNPQAAAHYLRTKVLTATPEQLQMMLYDGALRFGEQARIALVEKKYEDSYTLICKTQKILAELTGSLKHDVVPEISKKLAALYTYAYRQLVEASINHKLDALDDALKILRYQRETWALLMEQLGKQKAAAAATKLDMPAPDSRMEATISMRG